MTEANYAGGSISARQPINGDWDCKYQADFLYLNCPFPLLLHWNEADLRGGRGAT